MIKIFRKICFKPHRGREDVFHLYANVLPHKYHKIQLIWLQPKGLTKGLILNNKSKVSVDREERIVFIIFSLNLFCGYSNIHFN